MNAQTLKPVFYIIRNRLSENKELLTRLDSMTGDGDLGVTMVKGFEAVCEFLDSCYDEDVGRLLMRAGMTLNGAAPSTLGTILSVGLMDGGRALKGNVEIGLPETLTFFENAINGIMERAKSKRGDKTILDSLIPGYEALVNATKKGEDAETAFCAASKAAYDGMVSTISMRAIHGRAAYYAEESINHQDGGATVGSIIFAALAEAITQNRSTCT